jgi:hypothetical protein
LIADGRASPRRSAIQPKSFAFTVENLDWREIAKYPEGWQSSIIALLWRARCPALIGRHVGNNRLFQSIRMPVMSGLVAASFAVAIASFVRTRAHAGTSPAERESLLTTNCARFGQRSFS